MRPDSPTVCTFSIAKRHSWISTLVVATLLQFGIAQQRVLAQEPIFESEDIGILTDGQQVEISADITNAKELYLVVNDAGNGYSFDWADWLNPELIGKSTQKKLTELEWHEAVSGYGDVNKNRNCENQTLIVDRTIFENGIGTHANSVIHYKLPENHTFTTFTATGGLDNGGVSQGGGPDAKVRFLVFTTRPPAKFWPGSNNNARHVDHEIEQAINQFDVHPELSIGLFASEPMMVNPTNIDIDHLGRVWVCEVVNYRNEIRNRLATERPEGDRILILEDTDGDARADKSTVFYQGRDINSVHGICVLGDRAIVSAGDSVFYLIDNDGDSKADEKQILFTKIRGVQHDHGIHAFVFGPDGKLYFNFGNAGGQIADAEGNPTVDIAGNLVNDSRKPYQQGMVFRCNLDGSEFETLAWNFRNNWEVCIDSLGRLWQSDNDDDGNRGVRINYVMPFGNYGYVSELNGSGWRDFRTGWAEDIPSRHWHQNDPGVVPNLLQTGGGSPTGICFYEGDSLPVMFRNQIIHCDAGPSIVRCYPTTPAGAGFKATTIDIMDGARHNQWFRPSDVCVAPDGSLMIADWYDPGVGGHQMGDMERGRLFRVTSKGKQGSYQLKSQDFSSLAGSIEALRNPNLATRYMAFQALRKIGLKAMPELLKMMGTETKYMKARAFWVAQTICRDHNKPVGPLLDLTLAEKDEFMEVAARWSQLEPIPETADQFWDRVDIPKVDSRAVLRELAIALSRHQKRSWSKQERAAIWSELALKHRAGDRWYLEALGIGAEGHWQECLESYLGKTEDWMSLPAAREIVWRSRAPESLTYLIDIIRSNSTPLDELPKYFRAIDFQDIPTKPELLAELVFDTEWDSELDADRYQLVAKEGINRLGNLQLTPEQYKKLSTFVDSIAGTRLFVSLVAKYKLENRYHQLFELMAGDDRQLAIDSCNTLVSNGQSELLATRMKETDDLGFDSLLNVMALSANAQLSPMLSEYARDPSMPLERRKTTVRTMGKIYQGAKTLIRWLDAGKYDPQLEPAISAALHAAQWTDVNACANEYFPMAASKGEKPLPRIPDLMRIPGNAVAGQLVFANQGTCSKCHIVNKAGQDVGPDLSEIGSKLTREAMFESILFPSAGISHNYESWAVLTTDGTLISGLLISDSAQETKLRDATGVLHTFAANDIDEKIALKLSLMPADLHKELTAQQLVDVVEYLVSLKKKAD